MKEYSENQKNPVIEENDISSVESYQEDLVRSDNALKGLIPQEGNHFNPFDQADEDNEEEYEEDNEELDDDPEERDDDIDQENKHEWNNEDPERWNQRNQSDIPPEYPDRSPNRNYTNPQAH